MRLWRKTFTLLATWTEVRWICRLGSKSRTKKNFSTDPRNRVKQDGSDGSVWESVKTCVTHTHAGTPPVSGHESRQLCQESMLDNPWSTCAHTHSTLALMSRLFILQLVLRIHLSAGVLCVRLVNTPRRVHRVHCKQPMFLQKGMALLERYCLGFLHGNFPYSFAPVFIPRQKDTK